ncbi:MFS transporter [Salicibibacter kimchii]|uniref:MFS transporter n=1 Tax=Salicibibacter kimchii TaxID=2099786 RepID=A0A345C2Y8_9BACI|nr:MFS transporter [Salicibibacter kimchii]AXF57569.1 MFS transporter [Salicibibacter kimchii]
MKNNRWFALSLIATAVLFTLTLWFSASVISVELREQWSLTTFSETWLSAAVPGGFVIGAFISAYFGLADRFNTRKFFAVSALIGGLLNLLLIWVDHAALGIVIRMLTGMALAGVYPPSVKLISQWFPKKRGVAVGVLIAALTLGTAMPHFLAMFFVAIDVRLVIVTTSMLAIVAAIAVRYILQEAPGPAGQSSFSLGKIKQVLQNKPVMFANYGYFGHMWELYAMWTWLPAFLTASFSLQYPGMDPAMVSFLAFASIGLAGGLGCVLGGLYADRIGISQLTILAMAISAFCALTIGFTFGQPIWLTIILALLWGVSVIADSAQFSVAVSQFGGKSYVGTALTFQMCIGFFIATLSIQMLPLFQAVLGWHWVFVVLAIGPILGIISMLKYQRYTADTAVSYRKTG